jgi:hypothetical protein
MRGALQSSGELKPFTHTPLSQEGRGPSILIANLAKDNINTSSQNVLEEDNNLVITEQSSNRLLLSSKNEPVYVN